MTLAQEQELFRRRKKRAKNIAKIQRIKKLDLYFRNRVYLIMIVAGIIIGILSISAMKVEKRTDEVIQMQNMLNHVITTYSDKEMLKVNGQLINVIDSLQILIFVYNRRHQHDQAQIQVFLMKETTPLKTIIEVEEFETEIDSLVHDTLINDTIKINEI